MVINSRVRVVVTALLAATTVACASASGTHTEAPTDPCAAYAAQSPIAIDPSAAIAGTIGSPDIRYSPTAVVLWNTGHSLQADYAPGSGNAILLDGVRFDLVQFHFHRPAEHLIRGVPADMELHLVHKDERGSVAVLGVPIALGGAGDKGVLDELFKAIPAEKGWRNLPAIPLDANRLRPDTSPRLLRYTGSLTTAPFTECIRWIVYDRALFLSEGALRAYEGRFKDPYARQPEDLNGRVPVKVGP